MMALSTEPLDIAVDADGNFTLSDGDLTLVSGLDGVAQALRIRLLTFRGEWFLNLDHGVPYWEDILGQKYNADQFTAVFRDEITKEPLVVAVLSLDLDFNRSTRALSVRYRVRTEFGDLSDSIEVL